MGTTKSPKIRRLVLMLGEGVTEETQTTESQSFISQLRNLESSKEERENESKRLVYTARKSFLLSSLEFCAFVVFCLITSGTLALAIVYYLRGNL
jgi:hypothetical protein